MCVRELAGLGLGEVIGCATAGREALLEREATTGCEIMDAIDGTFSASSMRRMILLVRVIRAEKSFLLSVKVVLERKTSVRSDAARVLCMLERARTLCSGLLHR